MTSCLNCGGPAVGRYRPVLGRGRLERLCEACAHDLSSLVQAAGDSCQLSVNDARFMAWLETGRWTARDGSSWGPEDRVAGEHVAGCPSCAIFGEDDDV